MAFDRSVVRLIYRHKKPDISVARIALTWMLQKKSITSIIIGAKNNEQLIDNIASTLVKLSDKEMEKLAA